MIEPGDLELRAEFERRPTSARRFRPSSRFVRFVRAHWKVIFAAAIGVAVGVILQIGATLGWRSYSEWRLGHVVLTNDGPPLSVQVFTERGDEPATEPFDVGYRETRSLPEGDYQLRVTGFGLLGRTYRFAINRGETQMHWLNLAEGRMLAGEPETSSTGTQSRSAAAVPFARVTLALKLAPPRADFVQWTGQTLLRREGRTGKIIWDALRPAQPRRLERDPALWLLSATGNPRSGTVVDAAPDLNGDGIGELLWVSETTAETVAISGQDGSLLWGVRPEIDDATGPHPKVFVSQSSRETPGRMAQLLGQPVLEDVDADGTPDLIETVVFHESNTETAKRLATEGGRGASHSRRAALVISGRSGRLLWSYPIDKAFSDPPRDVGGQQATLCAAAEVRWWELSRSRDGSGSTRGPECRRQARSILDLCRFARCSTLTWTAMATSRCLRLALLRDRSNNNWRRSRAAPANSNGLKR